MPGVRVQCNECATSDVMTVDVLREQHNGCVCMHINLYANEPLINSKWDFVRAIDSSRGLMRWPPAFLEMR